MEESGKDGWSRATPKALNRNRSTSLRCRFKHLVEAGLRGLGTLVAPEDKDIHICLVNLKKKQTKTFPASLDPMGWPVSISHQTSCLEAELKGFVNSELILRTKSWPRPSHQDLHLHSTEEGPGPSTPVLYVP